MDGTDILAQICAETRAEVERRKAAMPLNAIKGKLHQRADPPRGFGAALTQTVAQGGFGLIAEIKQASPSGGMIRPEFDPPALARAYQAGGATCLSVLTDAPHFKGDLRHMVAARAAVPLPVLRKEFILDPWQVYESRVYGADCILLILAALTYSQARDLEDLARALDMDVLAEVHNQAELDRALGLQTPLIGINNRNLKTLVTSIETTIELAAQVPADRFLITESGIRTHADVLRLADVGARSFLVGESLLRQPDVTIAAQTLLGRRAADAA